MSARHVIIAGSGNAALCAGIAALESGARVTLLEKADASLAGGNSRYTAGAMRFAYGSREDILALLADPDDPRITRTDFGRYPVSAFERDMLAFNAGAPLNARQRRLIDESYATMEWLERHGVRLAPIWSRQAYERDGKLVFWGGLTLEAEGEGVGLVDAELAEFRRLGGDVVFGAECRELVVEDGRVTGMRYLADGGSKTATGHAVILGCGGFEASPKLRAELMGERWRHAKVRGTPHNLGQGLTMALAAGAALAGRPDGCHAVPMDRDMPDFGNLELPMIERKHYRKICYFLGVMLNARGRRFVNEGENFRNYTYAQFGRAILEQPGQVAWQVFDAKVLPLLYDEYRFRHASFVEADTLEQLVAEMDGVDADTALATLEEFNAAVDMSAAFDPTVLDARRTRGLAIDKTNWANRIDTPPYRAYPVTCGITFTYAGVAIDDAAAVLRPDGTAIEGLYACGEMVGDVFRGGYPGGSGLTSGAVFGRLAGRSAAREFD
ncbi:MAG: FAD-dependent tricarballylate dehydrogenase TcuA [Woeseiaceae bacterium]|nr:FAD-dependent tricarballylate dehydrogenase TcuA [Woeseiaceae bacterium]